jgi:uroporphyrinogen-III synthase
MAKSLLGKTVLITRPEGQNQRLCELLLNQGAKVIAFPTIEIEPLYTDQNYSNLSEFDFVIFTSSNAVKFSAPQLRQQHESWPDTVLAAAIGNSTKKVLHDHNLPCHISPAFNFSSESLLSMDNFKDLTGKKILIITGTDGRPFLKQNLQSRGAMVEEQFCYQRKVPNYPASAIIQLSKVNIDFVVCTSNSSLENLTALLGKQLGKYLTANKSIQLIGFSHRIIPLAVKSGFINTPIITAEASDDSVLAAINQLL